MPALALAPLGLPENNHFLRLCAITHNRKNWLFSDTPDGAEASMICYSIIEMVKAQNLNIYKYLMYLLENRPSSNMKDKELEKLLPWSEVTREQ